MTPRVFLGVDGGQSSTTAVIGGESGRVLGSGVAGPCNHVGAAEGRAKFVAALAGCVASACKEAGLDAASVRFASACLGFSGGPADKKSLVESQIRADRYVITTDAEIALAGATGGQPGIIVVAGTGSIAFGRNREGQTARAGGWGYLFGDEGGAFDIVRQALRAVLTAEERRGPATSLAQILLAATASTSANELLHRFYTDEFPRHRIASLAPLVDRAAQAGGVVAKRILDDAGRQLAELAHATRRQLFRDADLVRVFYAGGVFSCARLRRSFQREIESQQGCSCAAALHPPSLGALIEAYRAAGLSPVLMLRSQF